MNMTHTLPLVALLCVTLFSSCVTAPPKLSAGAKIGSQTVHVPGPSAMMGPSGQGVLVDAVVAAVVDSALDSDERRQKDAGLVDAIYKAIEDELARQTRITYVRQSGLKGVNNVSPTKLKSQDAVGFATANGLTHVARLQAMRGRGTKGFKDVPKLHLQAHVFDASGKPLGSAYISVTGEPPADNAWWQGVNPRDPKLLAQWQKLAREAAAQLAAKWAGL